MADLLFYQPKPKEKVRAGMIFEECGCCGEFHRVDYLGDCRNDAERYSYDDFLNEQGMDRQDITVLALD